MALDAQLRTRLAALASCHMGLELLVLYGSRARGDAHGRSDWDLAYLGAGVDQQALHRDLCLELFSDDIDLVDLRHVGVVIGYHVARDGAVIHEDIPGRFTEFMIEATLRWLDMKPVVRGAQREVLQELGP